MRVIVIDAKKLEVREEQTPDNENFLQYCYRTIDCSLVDVVRAPGFDIWCDDEGLLKEPKRFVSIHWNGKELSLAGTLVISSINKEGESTSLHEAMTLDIVKSCIAFVVRPE